MEEIIRQIKNQQEINFINVKEQILKADLETVFDDENNSIVISREQLLDYFEYVKNKIEKYFETLTSQELLQKPGNCEYTRLELILAQFRHLMWHVGLSSAITFASKKEWNEFTGLSGLRKMIKTKD